MLAISCRPSEPCQKGRQSFVEAASYKFTVEETLVAEFFNKFFSSFANLWENHIWRFLGNMSLVDILDIFLLSVLLYIVYRFMKDRRAGKLALGLLLFLGVLIVSSVLKMHAIQFIFQNFYQIGFLAIIIVFQPELRAALEKMGTTPFSGLKGLAPSDTKEIANISADIDVLCEAVCDMARSKTGALIVIERSTKLGEYIKSGVLINAQMSPFLLRNIFFNKAPLHDGAVIIRGHRIFAAGCFLPLSTTDDIVQSLGTRHRAAIGMSEASDAVVIVVSEETGIVSIATDGALKRNFNYNSLKQELLKLLVHSNRKSQLPQENGEEKQ